MKVPEYGGQQVAMQGGFNGQISGGDSRAGAIGAQQMGNLGNSISQAGGEMGKIAMDMQNTVNQVRINDSVNQAKEIAMRLQYGKDNGYSNIKGINALQRDSGKPLADEYADSLKEGLEKISSGLSNEAQRTAFSQHANGLVTQFHGQASAYEAQQFQEYSLSVADGTIKNRMNEIGLNYKNPDVVNGGVESIRAAVYQQGQLLGKGAEWIEAQARNSVSKAHTLALSSALDRGEIEYAGAYLKHYSGDMEADDLLRVQGVVTREAETRIGYQAAVDSFKKMQPALAPNDMDRAFNILIGTESGGKQFSNNGQPLASPKGAIGIAQVMPKTGPEAAKLAGLPWDEKRYKNDAEYNLALGKAYFGKQVQAFGGDLAQAFAAYNAGPGAMNAALKEAKKDGSSWLSHLPAETQAYVEKNVAAFNSGSGAPAKPTLQDYQNTVRDRLGPNATPKALQVAQQEATRLFDEHAKATKQHEEEATNSAFQAVIQNGGSYSSLPPQIRAAIPPQKVDEVMGFAQKIAKGEDHTNPALYMRLSNPDYLKTLTPSNLFALRGDLSEADYKSFSKDLNQIKANGVGDLNVGAMKSALDNRLQAVGVDDDKQVGAIYKFVRDSLNAMQQTSGKKLTDSEISKHVDELFVRSVAFRNEKFFGGYGDVYKERLLTMKPSDIPSDTKNKLKADFKAAGIPDPTDADLLGAYWQLKTTVKK